VSDTITPLVVTGEVSIKGPVSVRPGEPAPIPEIGFSCFTRSTAGDLTSPLLGHTPRRRCATLTFTGTAAGDSVYLCGSMSDTQRTPPQGALVTMGADKTHHPIPVYGTEELWIAPGQGTVQVGVVAEQRGL
jgi:hypothetical protein